ncbi:hypothetical protein ACFL27_14715 [candidate division CSSED10-310 bacterium]|uniref:Tetratricopeptide repeat protein n=1 Tax=candidate division CSSED10-310 bacterium TaxID=2855610 RepID=A0ABV6YZ18_UNCC1
MNTTSKLLYIGLLIGCVLPWLKTPLHHQSGIWLGFASESPLSYSSLTFFLVLLIGVMIISVRVPKLFPVVGWLTIGICLYFYINISCNHRHDLVRDITFDREQLDRIYTYYSLVGDKQNTENPLDQNYLSDNLVIVSVDQSPYLLVQSLNLVGEALSYGWYVIFFCGIFLIKLSWRAEHFLKWRWLPIPIIFVTLGVISVKAIITEIYLTRAQISFDNRNANRTLEYLHQATRWDSNLTMLPAFMRLSGNANRWLKDQGAATYYFAEGTASLQKGQYAKAMADYQDAVRFGLQKEVIDNIMADACWQSGKESSINKLWVRAQRDWKNMSFYPGGEDAFLYLSTTHMRIGGEINTQYALQDAEVVLEKYQNRLILADTYVTMGTSLDKQGEIAESRHMFHKSVQTFSLPKVINFRAQKAMTGM